MTIRRRELIKHELEFRRCEESFTYFCENYWYIRHPRGGATLFDMSDAQLDTANHFQEVDKLIILKARQIGYSTLMAAYVAWLAMFYPDQVIVMLSRRQQDARDLIVKVKYGVGRLPAWLSQKLPKVETWNADKVTFDNSSEIEAMPSKKEAARGKSVSLIILDEWAFFEDPDNAWASIEPTVDVGGRCFILSTANGAGTLFEEFYREASLGNSSFVSLFYPWSAGFNRDQAWYEAKERELPEWQLWQEYPANDVECWIRSGNVVFDNGKLDDFEWIAPRLGKVAEVGSWMFIDDPFGEFRLWEGPDDRCEYVIGADVAEGLAHGDYSSAHVLKLPQVMADGTVTPCVHVGGYHGHCEPDIFGQYLAMMGWLYNTALIGVEANNHGYATLVELSKHQHYRKIYKRRIFGQRRERRTKELGWLTTKSTKPKMIDDLSKGIRENSIVTNDEITIRELMTFVRENDGSMHGSPRDDRVISFSIAFQMALTKSARQMVVPQRGPEEGTWDYYAGQLDLEDRLKNRATTMRERLVMK